MSVMYVDLCVVPVHGMEGQHLLVFLQNSSTGQDPETSSLANSNSYFQASSPFMRDGTFMFERHSDSTDLHARQTVRSCSSLPIINPGNDNDPPTQRTSLDLDSVDLDQVSNDLEVIRVKVRRQSSKKKKKKRQQQKEEVLQVVEKVGPLSPESGYKSDRLSLRDDGGDSVHGTPESSKVIDVSAGRTCDSAEEAGARVLIQGVNSVLSGTKICNEGTEAAAEENPSSEKPLDWATDDPKPKPSSMHDSGVWKEEGDVDLDFPEIALSANDSTFHSVCDGEESSIYDLSPERHVRGIADGMEGAAPPQTASPLSQSLCRIPNSVATIGTNGTDVSICHTGSNSENLASGIQELKLDGAESRMQLPTVCEAGSKDTMISHPEIISEHSVSEEEHLKVSTREQEKLSSDESAEWTVRYCKLLY